MTLMRKLRTVAITVWTVGALLPDASAWPTYTALNLDPNNTYSPMLVAMDLNNNGQVTGVTFQYGFVYSKGQLTSVASLRSGSAKSDRGIGG